jgi:hypothetical protein
MNELRSFAEVIVRRWVGWVVLAVTPATLTLAAHPERALRANVLLLTLTAALLFRMSVGEAFRGWRGRVGLAGSLVWALDMALGRGW